jgi:ATP-dependent DNA helicase RecG
LSIDLFLRLSQAGSTKVLGFSDRMEVWNPTKMPPWLTLELLREPHGPIPRNPLIAEPLFRVQHVADKGRFFPHPNAKF